MEELDVQISREEVAAGTQAARRGKPMAGWRDRKGSLMLG